MNIPPLRKIRITEAEKIADRIGADAVVILGFKNGAVAGASYGQTKRQCDIAGQWMHKLIDDLANGEIIPPILGVGK